MGDALLDPSISTPSIETRESLAKRGRQLEILSIVWGAAEAVIALVGAHREGSIALAGFGLDSVIEVLSAGAVYWRMTHEMNHRLKHQSEKISLRIAGICLLALAAYILVQSAVALRFGHQSEAGALGIGITIAALICMPLLARAKRQVARGLNSAAMLTDSKQTDFCSIQAGIVLLGLAVQRIFGIGWADTAAAFLLVPFMIRAGVQALRGHNCCAH